LYKIRYALDGAADVLILLLERAFFASSENRVAAERNNYNLVTGQAYSHSEGEPGLSKLGLSILHIL
jgi:hypothetical protein